MWRHYPNFQRNFTITRKIKIGEFFYYFFHSVQHTPHHPSNPWKPDQNWGGVGLLVVNWEIPKYYCIVSEWLDCKYAWFWCCSLKNVYIAQTIGCLAKKGSINKTWLSVQVYTEKCIDCFSYYTRNSQIILLFMIVSNKNYICSNVLTGWPTPGNLLEFWAEQNLLERSRICRFNNENFVLIKTEKKIWKYNKSVSNNFTISEMFYYITG